MPMIDIYATRGTFQDVHQLAIDAVAVVKGVEGVPDIPLIRKNTAAFAPEMREREKQIAVVRQLTDLASRAADDPTLPDRTWVILTEAIAGGWGLRGHAHTNGVLIDSTLNRSPAQPADSFTHPRFCSERAIGL
jgi:phenylpyruvate tautomerase PptA (4-oxalocrotonate tautomerase family)